MAGNVHGTRVPLGISGHWVQVRGEDNVVEAVLLGAFWLQER